MTVQDLEAVAFSDRTRRILWSHLRNAFPRINRADIEDVVQETLITAHANLHRYDPERSPFLGWLHVIADSRAIDHLRKCRTITLHDDCIAEHRTPERAVCGREMLQKIFQAFDPAPGRPCFKNGERYRIFLVLRAMGVKESEMQRRFSVPPGTLKSIRRLAMHAALYRLEQLQGEAL